MSFEREERYSVVKLEGLDGEGEYAIETLSLGMPCARKTILSWGMIE